MDDKNKNKNKKDIEIECKDCQNKFILSIHEQEFYEKNNLKTPKRCKTCRDKRKQLNK